MKLLNIIKSLRPHLTHRALPLAALALATACCLNSAQAFSVVWETPAKNSGSDTDVVTTGHFVRAVAGSPVPGYGATVNGVEFTPYASTSSDPYSYGGTEYNTLSWGVPGEGGWTDSLAKTTTNIWGLNSRHGWPGEIPPSGLTTAYQQILRGVRDSGGAPVTMTLGGLTVGQSYLVQLWAMDGRGSVGNMPQTTMYLDGDPNTAMLTNRGFSGDPGQYIIGRFVAAGTEQTFTLTGNVFVNAYQLRTIDPPPADPVVAIISPADNTTVFTTFTINATAGAPAGTITSVTFSYSDNAGVTWTQLAEDTEVPYSYTWSSAPAGDYQIKAVAVDNLAHSTTALVHVTVADTAPTVAITSPVDAGYAARDFTIRATATDDGAITHVDFYDGAALLGTATTPPYTWAVTGAQLGAHVLTAKAYDNGSQETTSAAVHVTVVTPVAIVWETPAKNSGSDTDVATEGDFVRAVAGSPVPGYGATVNGVEFTPYAVTPSNEYAWNGAQYNTLSWGVAGAGGWTDSLAKTTTNIWGLNSRHGWPGNYSPSGLTTVYQQILRGVRDSGGAPVTMTLGGLTVGQSYLVQLWAMDGRGSDGHVPPTTMYLDGDPNTAMLTNRGTSGDPGQYIIGRFVANSTEQSFTLTGNVFVNAYQLRANSGTSTTTVVTTSGPSTVGELVTLTATVTPAPTGGTVQFYDNTVAIGSPATVNTGTGIATFATTDLTVGSHTITATYGGTTGFLTSADSVGASQTVSPRSAFAVWSDGITNRDKIGPNDDPDGDGANNLIEFAFNGDPNSAADSGKVYGLTGESSYNSPPRMQLILTVAVRKGTPEIWATPTESIDGISYTIQGSLNLTDNFTAAVTPVVTFTTPAMEAALTDSNYQYRSFVLDDSNGLGSKGFLRAMVTQP